MMVTIKDLNTPAVNTWCPGCGNFGILNALKRAIVKLDLDPSNVVIVSGIGCHGKIVDYIRVNGFHGIHGRVLPVATAVKLANHKLTVIGHGGDGDSYAIGIGHLPHAARRNIDITLIVHDNKIYGLTTGQTSPTSPRGIKTKSTPFGAIEIPIDPISLAIVSGATFVARGYSGDIEHLTWLIQESIKHKGFALIDVLQPCVTFYNTYSYYSKRVYRLEDDESYDNTNREMALERAQEWNDKIPIGIFYRARRPVYEDELPQLKKGPLVEHNIENIDISKLLEEFK